MALKICESWKAILIIGLGDKVLFCCSNDCGLAASKAAQLYMATFGGKGGGSRTFAQVGGLTIGNRDESLAEFVNVLRNEIVNRGITAALLFFLLRCAVICAQEQKSINLEHSDTFEILRGLTKDTIFISGSVQFARDGGKLLADSAMWVKGETIVLHGHVFIQDSTYELTADSVNYDVIHNLAYASGKEVIILGRADSIRAVGY